MSKRKRAEDGIEADDLRQKPVDDNSQSISNAFEIPVDGKKPIQCTRHGEGKPDLIFTHGAGGDLKTPAMQDFATGFTGDQSSNLVMFKGNMNLKSRTSSFHRIMEHEGCYPALGGRSMGARAASLAAQESEGNVKALVLASFPLVGQAKGDSREQILLDLPEGIDVLFISGDNDSMCDISQLQGVMRKMKARGWLVTVEGVDHGMALKPKAGSQPLRVATGEIASEWLKERDYGKRWLNLVWDEEEDVVVSSGWQEEQPGPAGGDETSPGPTKD